MKNNIERLQHFNSHSAPTPDDVGYKEVMEFIYNQVKNNPKWKKEIDKKFENASRIGLTQSKNGIGFLQSHELRFFHLEFNERIRQHGFGALPAAFSILEGFFKWNADLFYFELLEEEEHLFSLFDFFDFVTSKNCSGSLDYFIENVEDELIYSYNILNDIKELTFSTSDSKEYVIGGVSLVKRNNEVFILMVAGEIGDLKELSKELPDNVHDFKGKSYIKPAADRIKEVVPLLEHKDIWKVNVYARIDLDRKTIDSRYVQKDFGIGFSTITDDYGMLERSIKDKDELLKLTSLQAKEISTYTGIFEAAYYCLYLPEYYDYYDNLVLPEEHPTSLYKESLKNSITKNKSQFNSNYFFRNKDVWVLDRKVSTLAGKSVLKKTELKIEKDGYWKQLEAGKLGVDKNGKEIHNRTWVEKTLAWHESSNPEKDIEVTIPETVSSNKGFIYLLRNPSHEEDIFKIGLTTRTVEERAKELYGTSSPDKFLIISKWSVQDCALVEKLIHEKLDKFRLTGKREFFKMKLEHAITEILPIINEINNKA